jgi:hypothetical protein
VEEKTEKQFSEKTAEMVKVFLQEKSKWTDKIFKLTDMLKNYEKFNDLQIEIYNEITNALNDKATISNHLVKINKILRQKKYENLIELKTNLDLKVRTKDDQIYIIENNLKDILEREEVLLLQIDYMDNIIKNLKDILWGIKNYIEIKKLLE